MTVRALLVMDRRHRSLAVGYLQKYAIEFAEASDRHTARQILSAGPRFDLVIADVTLPDGTWCSVLLDLLDTGFSARLLVCADRHDQLLCGEVVGRGGYYAVSPPSDWQPLQHVIGPPRARSRSTTRRANTASAAA